MLALALGVARADPAGEGSAAAAAALPRLSSGAFVLAAPPSPADPPGRADYRIDARLEDLEGGGKGLQGRLVLRWTNGASVAAEELLFHLYWNAYANNRSTHLVEAGGRLRGSSVENGWGWQRVESVRVGDRDVTASFRYRQPDGGPVEDRTVFSVVPPQAVGPGETVTVAIEWSARVPALKRRTGAKDDFVLAAHWFPKLGVFEGERGWNCHEFHAMTEFFSNFGWYDVTLDLPERYEGKVFGSGLQIGPSTVEGGRTLVSFQAPSPQDRERVDTTGRRPLVHGFAWTADPRFKLRRGTFNYDLWRNIYEDEVARVQQALGRDKNLRLRTVQVSVLMQPEREDQWERHLQATCAALFFYGLWFGEYPYEHVTVVDPAWGASAAGGMEYPTLFTGGSRLFTRPSMHSPEGVVVHECGHQFWYGLVGNNEFEAAWMDEGLNSYTDSEVIWRVWGERESTTEYAGLLFDGVMPAPGPGGGRVARALSLRAFPLPFVAWELEPLRSSGLVDLWRDQAPLTAVERRVDPRWNDRIGYLSDPDRDRIDTAGWLFADGRGQRVNSYQRPAVALRTLEGLVGREAFLRGMRHFAETWRYRHPYPDDFFAAFQEGSGTDVGWYFQDAFRDTATVDWGVRVEQRRALAPEGLFQSGPGQEFLPIDPPPAPPGAGAVGEQGAAEGGPPPEVVPPTRGPRPWEAQILVTRRGALRLPLDIELRFEDGKSERVLWTREEQAASAWLKLELDGRPKLVAVVLDPDQRYWLDSDLSDNRWYDQADDLAPLRWSERVFNRWLHLLHWQAGIGG